MKNERPLPVVGTQLPQCRARRSQRAQHYTAPDYQLQKNIVLPVFEMVPFSEPEYDVDKSESFVNCQWRW